MRIVRALLARLRSSNARSARMSAAVKEQERESQANEPSVQRLQAPFVGGGPF